MATAIRLDLNNPEFQELFFSLEKPQQLAVLKTFQKLRQMTWEQVYTDSGSNWEAILSKTGPGGGRLYSFRIGKGFRGVAYLDDAWLRVLGVYPDHDSAYR
ncbi:MAG: hypothetical protein L0H63_02255 [Nitrococcus sp.]|nr:hypothetical protein [Nitrococcus sp.]